MQQSTKIAYEQKIDSCIIFRPVHRDPAREQLVDRREDVEGPLQVDGHLQRPLRHQGWSPSYLGLCYL